MCPFVDLHCYLLTYLADNEDSHTGKTEDIGCASPHLQEDHVKL